MYLCVSYDRCHHDTNTGKTGFNNSHFFKYSILMTNITVAHTHNQSCKYGHRFKLTNKPQHQAHRYSGQKKDVTKHIQ